MERCMNEYIFYRFIILFTLISCTSDVQPPFPDLFWESKGTLNIVRKSPIREVTRSQGIDDILCTNDSIYMAVGGVPDSLVNSSSSLVLRRSINGDAWTTQRYWNSRKGRQLRITNLAMSSGNLIGLDPFGRIFDLNNPKNEIPELLFRLHKPKGRDGLMLHANNFILLQSKKRILASLHHPTYGVEDLAYYEKDNTPIGVFSENGVFQEGFLEYPEVFRKVKGNKSFRMEAIGTGEDFLFVHQVPNDYLTVYDHNLHERNTIKLPDMQYLKQNYTFKAVPDSILQISDPWKRASKKDQNSLPPDYVQRIVVEKNKLRLFFVSPRENKSKHYSILDCNLVTGACRETLVKQTTNQESVSFFPMIGDRIFFITSQQEADGKRDIVLHEAVIK